MKPAIELPETALHEVLEENKQLIRTEVVAVGRMAILRPLLYMLEKQLAESRSALSNRILLGIPLGPATELFNEILLKIESFSSVDVVQKELLARLQDWVNGEITAEHHSAFHSTTSRQKALI